MRKGTKKQSKTARTAIAALLFLSAAAGCGRYARYGDVRAGTEMKCEEKDGKNERQEEARAMFDANQFEAMCGDLYDEAEKAGGQQGPDMMRRIAERLGRYGYAAVDRENQVDMENADQVLDFCRAFERQRDRSAPSPGGTGEHLKILVADCGGILIYDFAAEGEKMKVRREYFERDAYGNWTGRGEASYFADTWKLTREGYLLFSGSYFSEEAYALTLSEARECAAIRALPLDPAFRQANRDYILCAGYRRNNLFLCNWGGTDFGELDFYDMFDVFYPVLYGRSVPYLAGEYQEEGAVFLIPESVFETVIQTFFDIDIETLRSKTKYSQADGAYEYRPRGCHEAQYPDIPYPEVAGVTKREDGTLALTVHAVYPEGNTSRAFTHETVIRPQKGKGFQYVSNRVWLEEEPWWHAGRLTEEEWSEIYGVTAGGGE